MSLVDIMLLTGDFTQKTNLLGERAHLPINPTPITYATDVDCSNYKSHTLQWTVAIDPP